MRLGRPLAPGVAVARAYCLDQGPVHGPARQLDPTETPDQIRRFESACAAAAQELDAILLSLNGDFADIVSYPPRRFKGIVSLQILNHPEVTRALTARLLSYLAAHPRGEYYRGKLIVVEADRVRTRD